MIYVYMTDMGPEPHTDKDFAEKTLGLGKPLAVLTDEQWAQHDGMARMIDGGLVLGRTEAERTEEKAQQVRAERDRRLSATDWTQLADNPLKDDPSITAYRQALRDVPQQEGFPLSVVWPVRVV
jgi:hypothetical protein